MFDIKTQHIAFGLPQAVRFVFILFYAVCFFLLLFPPRALKLYFGYGTHMCKSLFLVAIVNRIVGREGSRPPPHKGCAAACACLWFSVI